MTIETGRPRNNPGIPKWRPHALKLRRIAAGWTLNDLSERLQVSKSTVSRWETGLNTPTGDQLDQLADMLQVPKAVFAREPKIV